MDASDLDYELPTAAIAQHPVEPRDRARLLVDHGPDTSVEHRRIRDLPDLLRPDDILILNDTRVIPARLALRKPTGGAVEVLLLERHPDGWWEGLVKPSRRVADGTILRSEPDADGSRLSVEVGERLAADGRRRITIHDDRADDRDRTDRPVDRDLALLEEHGEVPLPPYIHEPIDDVERYQTVYARNPGSVAAPTAGLHLTEDLLETLRTRGITIASVELVVGLGTFRPITEDRVEDHPMHRERYRIPDDTRELLEGRGDRRVIAVGTTVVRALEAWRETGETDGTTDLFIRGDRPWRIVDGLLTNFHVPRSSLLALVHAFVGDRWRELYTEALRHGYRFLSFGDAMLLPRRSDAPTADRIGDEWNTAAATSDDRVRPTPPAPPPPDPQDHA